MTAFSMLLIVYSWKSLSYGKTKTCHGAPANFEPRIFKRKSVLLLLVKFGQKNYQCVGETCILNNPFLPKEFVAFFERDSKLNVNWGFNL